jgi:glycosyltransferase involved in cell wall biosynthesis
MISVVIPTHNRPEDLRRALLSVAEQSCHPAEVIVVDDGSEPPVSRELIEEAGRGLNVSLYRNAVPAGGNRARNLGVEKAASPWIAFLDDDDEFDRDKIRYLSEAIRSNPECDVIYHAADIRMVEERVSYRSQPRRFGPQDDVLSALLIRNEIGGTSMVAVRKAKFLEVGGFDESFPALQDYEMWIRLASQGASFLFIDRALTRYHHMTGKRSITKSLSLYYDALARIDRKYQAHFSALGPGDMRRRDIARVRGVVHRALVNGDIALAWKAQWRHALMSRKLSDLLALFVIPFGSPMVFRLRAWLGRQG